MLKTISYYKGLLRAMIVQTAQLKDMSSNLEDAANTYKAMRKGKDKNAEKYMKKKHDVFNKQMEAFTLSSNVDMKASMTLISKMDVMKNPIENSIIEFKNRRI